MLKLQYTPLACIASLLRVTDADSSSEMAQMTQYDLLFLLNMSTAFKETNFYIPYYCFEIFR